MPSVSFTAQTDSDSTDEEYPSVGIIDSPLNPSDDVMVSYLALSDIQRLLSEFQLPGGYPLSGGAGNGWGRDSRVWAHGEAVT